MLHEPAITWGNRLLALTPAFLRPHWDRLRASPLGYRLAKGAFWSLAGVAISRGAMLLSSIFVARLLGRAGFGELGIIQNTVSLFGVLAGMGMGLAATKYIAEYRVADPVRAGRILTLMEQATLAISLLALIALVLAAPWLARYPLAAPHLTNVLQLGALLLPFCALNGVQNGTLAGLESFRTIAFLNLRGGLASFPLIVGGAWYGGLAGAILGVVASQALLWFLSHRALRRELARCGIARRSAGWPREWRVLRDFSLPALLTNATTWCGSWICSALLVQQTNGYAEMGIVTVGTQWRNALLLLPGLLANTTLPVLSHERLRGDSQFCRTLSISHRLLVPMVLPVALVLMMAAGKILGLYGSGFLGGRDALVYLLAAAAVSAVSSPAGSAIIALGKMWLALALNLSSASIFVLLTLWLIPSGGAAGLAFAYLAGQSLQAVAGYLCLAPHLAKGMLSRNLSAIAAICLSLLAVSRL